MTTKSDGRFWFIVIGLIVPVFVLFYFFVLPSLDPKDSCLDAGGSYNAETKQCEMNKKTDHASHAEQKEQPFLTQIIYSNLADDVSQKEVESALTDAGISSDNVASFLEDVNYYNTLIEKTSLQTQGFISVPELQVDYDMANISDLLGKNNPHFVGQNCRITSFGLMKDLIHIDKPEMVDSSQLFIDKDALLNNPKKVLTADEQQYFESFFSIVPTTLTKDTAVHLANIQNAWKEKGIHFADSKATLVSVWFHSHFEGEDDYLFIGHMGVLVPSADGKLLFIEKLSFEEPYQALKFDNRQQLSDYLMARYDNEW